MFDAGTLLLDGFDNGQDFSFGQQDAIVNGVSQDTYIFTVDSGSWSGDSLDPLVELESVNGGVDNQLEVATAFFGNQFNPNFTFNGLVAGSISDQVSATQFTPTFTFDTLEFENFTNVDQSLALNTIGDLNVGALNVVDSDPTDNFNPSIEIRIETIGSIEVKDNTTISNEVNNALASVSLRANGAGNDVFVSGSIETQTGNIDVTGADEVRMRTSASVIDSGAGRVTLTSLGGNTSVGEVTSLATGGRHFDQFVGRHCRQLDFIGNFEPYGHQRSNRVERCREYW